MRHTTTSFCLAAVLAAVAVALPTSAHAAPETVSMRIEGDTATLFEGKVRSDGRDVTTASGGTHKCDGTNAGRNPTAGATFTTAAADGLSIVGKTLDGTYWNVQEDFSLDRFAEVSSTSSQFWGLLRNEVFASGSGCQELIGGADRALWAFDAFRANLTFLQASASTTRVAPGEAVVVTVTGQAPQGGQPTAASGVHVAPVQTDPTTGYQTPLATDPATVTTDAAGKATLTWSTSGWKRVKAVGTDRLRSNRVDVCVSPCGPNPPADTLVRSPDTVGPQTTDDVTGDLVAGSRRVTLTATDTTDDVAATYYTTGSAPSTRRPARRSTTPPTSPHSPTASASSTSRPTPPATAKRSRPRAPPVSTPRPPRRP